MSGNDAMRAENADRMVDLERAVEQALDLRQTVHRIPVPLLYQLIDLILVELGQMLAAKHR